MKFHIKLNLVFFLMLVQNYLIADVCHWDEVHALILARGGSKGIKHKNLLKIDGISILGRTLTTIRNTRLFAHIWVSTDSGAIAAEAMKFGALVHVRPEFYARDNTSSLESVQEFLEQHSTVRRFALFQCTSVFLKEHYIVEALALFEKNDCVFSVKRSHALRWQKVDGKVKPLNFNPALRPRRQDWTGELVETGMFYFSSRELIEQERFQNEKCAVVEVNATDSLEIDSYEDVHMVNCLIELGKEREKQKVSVDTIQKN